MRTATLPIAVDRWQPATLTVRVVGVDMSGSVNRLQARLIADTPGLPLIDLTDVTNGNAEGIRLVSVAIEDGRPVSTFKLRINETTVEALPPASSRGDNLVIGYDWQTSIGGDRRLLARGPLTVVAGFTGADNAPSGVPSSYGDYAAQRGSAPWSTAQLTFSDDDVTISIDGTDLLGVAQDQALAAIGLARDLAVEAVQNSAGGAAGYAAAAATSADRAASHAGIDATFATKAAAAAAQIAVGKVVQVLVDETMSGSRTIYQKRADGTLAFIATLLGAGDLASTAAQRGAALVAFDAGRTVRDVLLARRLEKILAACRALANANEYPAGGLTPYPSVGAGRDYPQQFVWDSGFTAQWMVSIGQAPRAAKWMLNWAARQRGDGMLPCNFTSGDAQFNYSQVPVLAWTCWLIFASTNDLNWLNTMYGCFKKWFAWWQNSRMDASGLFMWGSSRTDTSNLGLLAQDARFETGQDDVLMALDEQYAQIAGTTLDHVSPDLSGALCNEADYLAKMANALGLSSEQAGWEATRDGIRDRMRKLMWDGQMGRFAMIGRSDLARGIGKAAATNSGAMEIAMQFQVGFPIARGTRVVFGDAIGQVAVDVAATDQKIVLSEPLTAAIAAGADGFARTVLSTAPLSFHVFPLLAGVPTQAQARRIIDEHINYEFDGSVADACDVYFGNVFAPTNQGKGYHLRYKHLAWHGPMPAGATTKDSAGWTHPASNADRMITRLSARGMASDQYRDLAAFLPEWETTQRFRPLTLAVSYRRAAGAGGLQLSYTSYPQGSGPVYNAEFPQPNGADGSIVTTIVDGATVPALASGYRPYFIDVFQLANTSAPLVLTKMTATFAVRGFVYRVPGVGILANPRLSDNSRATETNSDVADSASTPLRSDYWKGDIWPQLEYVLLKGMERYGMNSLMVEFARDMTQRMYTELLKTGELWERYSMRGQGKGSRSTAWTGLIYPIAQIAGDS